MALLEVLCHWEGGVMEVLKAHTRPGLSFLSASCESDVGSKLLLSIYPDCLSPNSLP